jgi:hypothetical protein
MHCEVMLCPKHGLNAQPASTPFTAAVRTKPACGLIASRVAHPPWRLWAVWKHRSKSAPPGAKKISTSSVMRSMLKMK